jgi:hypothetical protein
LRTAPASARVQGHHHEKPSAHQTVHLSCIWTCGSRPKCPQKQATHTHTQRRGGLCKAHARRIVPAGLLAYHSHRQSRRNTQGRLLEPLAPPAQHLPQHRKSGIQRVHRPKFENLRGLSCDPSHCWTPILIGSEKHFRCICLRNYSWQPEPERHSTSCQVGVSAFQLRPDDANWAERVSRKGPTRAYDENTYSLPGAYWLAFLDPSLAWTRPWVHRAGPAEGFECQACP